MKKNSISAAQERSDSAAGGIDLEDEEAVVEVARCSESWSFGSRNWGWRRWAARTSTPATHPGEEVETAGNVTNFRAEPWLDVMIPTLRRGIASHLNRQLLVQLVLPRIASRREQVEVPC